jgi:uncharacterized protein
MKIHRSIVSLVLVVFIGLLMTGCITTGIMERSRTVSVTGAGTVAVVPDLASFSISVSELGETTKEAQAKANAKIGQLREIIRAAAIEDKDLATTAIGFWPEYKWVENEQILVGQRASQNLYVTVRGIVENPAILGQLIDSIGGVGSITVSSISFSKEDTTEAYTTSRMLAMEKAVQKAQEYAKGGGMILGKPLSIQDYATTDYQPTPRNMAKADAMYMAESSYATDIPTGELSITSTVSVVFEIH